MLERDEGVGIATSGVNFINIIRAAFTRADPKSAIKLLYLNVFFALLGFWCIKAGLKILVKLTLGYSGSVPRHVSLTQFGNTSPGSIHPKRSGTSSVKLQNNVQIKGKKTI